MEKRKTKGEKEMEGEKKTSQIKKISKQTTNTTQKKWK